MVCLIRSGENRKKMEVKYVSPKKKKSAKMLLNDQQFIVAWKDHNRGIAFVGSTGDGDSVRFIPIEL